MKISWPAKSTVLVTAVLAWLAYPLAYLGYFVALCLGTLLLLYAVFGTALLFRKGLRLAGVLTLVNWFILTGSVGNKMMDNAPPEVKARAEADKRIQTEKPTKAEKPAEKHIASKQKPSPAKPAPKPAVKAKPAQKSYGKLFATVGQFRLFNVVGRKDDVSSIEGIVVNDGEPCTYAAIYGKVFDSEGHIVATPMDNIAGLSTGETWKFKMTFVTDEWARYQIEDIQFR